MRTRAAVTDGRGNFEVVDVKLGAPESGEVLIRVLAAGVCHTDWDSLRWGTRMILGHEGAGIVEDVGAAVTSVSIGDRVLLNWARPCGECFQCHRGAENICEKPATVPAERSVLDGKPLMRSFGLGTMATHAVVPQEAVIPLKVDIDFKLASILGCAVMTGYGSVLNVAKAERGSSVVVLGVGGVGLSVVQGAVEAMCAVIIAVDLSERRLAAARAMGATHTIKANAEVRSLADIVPAIRTLTGGRGADYAFECTGVPEVGLTPLSFVRNGGTVIAVSGIEQEVTVDFELFQWDKAYVTPLYGQCRPALDFPFMLQRYAERRLKLDELVSHTYPLDALGQAFDDMLARVSTKGVLVLD